MGDCWRAPKRTREDQGYLEQSGTLIVLSDDQEQVLSKPRIALVVIGRNSARPLDHIYHPEAMERVRDVFDELLYIDSASSDGSPDLMRARGFSVHGLAASGVLSAAAGRWLGTLRASSEYVLYVDSDMELVSTASILTELSRFEKDGFDGWAGRVTDISSAGQRRERVRRSNRIGEVHNFGGFVCIRRESVLQAGNWNPAVIANEEIELYARLKKSGTRIGRTDVVQVLHHGDARNTPARLVLSVYLPWMAAERYGALGFALAAALRAGSARELVRITPEPFALLAGVALSLGAMKVGGFPAGSIVTLLATVGYELILLSRRSWRFNFVVPGILLSIPVGLLRYRDASPSVGRKAE